MMAMALAPCPDGLRVFVRLGEAGLHLTLNDADGEDSQGG